MRSSTPTQKNMIQIFFTSRTFLFSKKMFITISPFLSISHTESITDQITWYSIVFDITCLTDHLHLYFPIISHRVTVSLYPTYALYALNLTNYIKYLTVIFTVSLKLASSLFISRQPGNGKQVRSTPISGQIRQPTPIWQFITKCIC